MSSRRLFHILLGAAFLPALSLPVVWIAALREWRRSGYGPDRRWAARILALAVVDTLVLAAIIVLAGPGRDEIPAGRAPVRRLVIGVIPDRTFSGPGVRLGTVTPGGPAAKAGLRVGDVIEAVDGEQLSTFDELRDAILDGSLGVPLELRIHRGESVFTVEVEPVWSDQIPVPRRTLFQAEVTGTSCLGAFGAVPWKPIALEVLLLAVLAVAGRHAGVGAGVSLTMLALVVSTGGALAGWLASCLLLGGPSAGGALLSMWGTPIGLLLTALVGRTWIRPLPIVASHSVSSAILLGAWYAVTGAIRLTIILGAVQVFLPSTPHATAADLFAPALRTEGSGLLIVAVGAVVLAPLGEELVFRGMLLPSLIPWVGTTAALWISAVVFGGLHWYYGVMTPVIVLFGWVLGWARVASGGVRAPIFIHALMNLVPITVMALRH